MAGEFNRWSQIVRTPGAAHVVAHHPVDVPSIDQSIPYSDARRGLRLLVHSVGDPRDLSTIDITATATIAMLEPWLATGLHLGRELSWKAAGYGNLRRDTLRIRPLRNR